MRPFNLYGSMSRWMCRPVDVSPLAPRDEPDAQNIVRYDHIVADIKAHLAQGHVDLVETLAEDIAAAEYRPDDTRGFLPKLS